MAYNRRDHLYVYNGNAVALGGYLERDGGRAPFDSVAPAVLSIVGGMSHSGQRKFCFPEKRGFFSKRPKFEIRVKYAESEVVGRERAGGYVTTARSRLEGFDINGVVKADLVEALLESTHSVVPGRRDEGEIRVSNEQCTSRIEGLTVNGVRVETKLSTTLSRFARFGDLHAFLSQPDDGNDRALISTRRSLCDISLRERPNIETVPAYIEDLCRFQRDDVIRCTIFESITSSKKLPIYGYTIDVPDFGRLFLGELLVSRGQKRLNMIRFDLGCGTAGGGTGGGASVDGEPLP